MSATDNNVAFGLDPEVARPLAVACAEYVAQLRGLLGDAIGLGTLSGFGTLESGRQLQRKFEQKADGGPDALVDVLKSHIAVVTEMQAQFQACIDSAVNQETANAAALRTIDPPN